MKVTKSGDGLALELPQRVVEDLGIKEGDEVQVRVAGLNTIEIEKRMTPEEAIQRLKEISRPLPPGFKFDRFEANER